MNLSASYIHLYWGENNLSDLWNDREEKLRGSGGEGGHHRGDAPPFLQLHWFRRTEVRRACMGF